MLSAARLNWVRQVELAKHAGTHDGPGLGYSPADSRELVSAPQAHFAYDGSGVRVGVLDTGIWADHDDFGGAIAWQYDQETGQSIAPDSDGHGTRVAGVIGGRGVRLPATRGVAPGALLYVAKGHEVDLGSNLWGYDPGDAFDQFLGQEVFLVNNSWGTRLDAPPDNPWNFGYDSAAALADAYADNEALTLIFSAGNEGDSGATITEPGVGKNVITVGAVSYTNDGDSGGVGRVPCYSSRGPTADDGRLKPDVVAPGGDAAQYTGDCVWSDHDYGVVTCNAQTNGVWLDSPDQRWGLNPPESFYTRQAGTSMAAPHVTGIAAMLYQAYGDDFPYDDGLVPRDIKALLVANAMPIHDYGTNPVNGYANTDTGYGLVDAYYTLFDIAPEKLMLLWGHGGVVETTANSQDWSFYVTSGVRRLAVVLCYEDDEGEEHDGDALKDDLDLTLKAPNGTEFTFTLPAGVSMESPLEKIVVNTPSVFGTGEWTATVTGAEWNELLDPFEFQRYTIVVTAYYIDPYSPSISVETAETIDIAPGEAFSVSATIANLNGLTAAGITAELSGDAVFGGDVNTTQFVGNIVGKDSTKQIEFTGLVAPETVGQHTLTLTVSGVNRNLANAVQTIQVNVGTELPSGGPQVTVTSPVDGGPLVSQNVPVRVRFSTTMDIASFDTGSCAVVGSSSGLMDGVYALDGSLREVTFYPESDFVLDETITVTLNEDIMSDGGERLTPHSFAFHILPSPMPTVEHSGTLSSHEVWQSDSVHIVTGNVTIPADLSLTITPGTVVKFNAVDTSSSYSNIYRYNLLVQGTLDAQGTPGARVVFTSSRDDMYGGDTNGDGAGSSPGTGNWGAIKFTSSTLNTLQDALVRYGGVGRTYRSDYYDTQMIWIEGAASLTIQDCVIERAYDKALYVNDANCDLTLSGGAISSSGKGAYLVSAATMNMSGCTIDGNGYGVYQAGNSVWNLTNNTFAGNTYPIYQANSDLLIYSGNTITSNTYQAIAVSGTLTGDVMWENVQDLDLAYLLIGDVTVPAAVTLTIGAGVVVKFQAVDTSSSYSNIYRNDIIVDGVLNLQGTSELPVVFTSDRDDSYGGDTNGNGDANSPAKGNWGAIRYQGSAANVLHDAVIRYGGVGYTYRSDYYDKHLVWIKNNACVTIRDCVIEQAYEKAVFVEDDSEVTVQDSAIRNSSYGIYIQETAAADIEGSTLESNSYGIYQAGSSQLAVTGNTLTSNTYPVYQGATDIVYSGNTVTGNTYQAILVGGTLVSDVAWDNIQDLDLAYVVVSDVTVPAAVTLTVDAGVVVKFQAVDTSSSYSNIYRHDIIVDGVLNLLGTSESPVVFTSDRDDTYGGDTNGDEEASSPGKGNWGAIRYQGIAANTLHDAVIRYGGVGYTYRSDYYDKYMVWIKNNACVTIQDCVIEQAYDKAVFVEDDSEVILQDCTVRNSGYGIYIQETATADIIGNLLDSNSYGIYQAGSSQLTVTGNTVTNNTYPVYQGATDIAYSGNIVTGNTYQAILVGGTLIGDVTWDNVQEFDLAYLVQSDVTVPADVTLTIDPGVVVKFQAVDAGGSGQYRYRYDIIVDGVLNVLGTSLSPVVFTSSRDDAYGGDTNGDEGASLPAKGNWGAIHYRGSATHALNNAVLRYGGVGYTYHYANNYYDTQMVWVSNDVSLTIQDCVIEQSYQKAVFAEDDSAVTIQDSTVRTSAYGIYVQETATADIAGNTLDSNSYGIYQAGSSQLIVTGNAITNNTYPVYQGYADLVYTDNTVTDNTYQAILVGGVLVHDVAWDNVQELDLAYLVISDVTIPADLTLTIAPGVVVKFMAVDAGGSGQYCYRHDIFVNGVLNLQGTSGLPVVFTSSRDDTYGGDTNGDGDASSPAKGNWGAIHYQGSVANVLHDAVLRYGGVGHTYHYANYYYDTQMVWILNEASVTIQDCVIEQAYQKAVLVEDDSTVSIQDSTVRNSSYGVYIQEAATADINSNALESNSYGIYHAGSSQLTVTDNTIANNTYPVYQGYADLVYSGNTVTDNTYQAVLVGGTLVYDVVWDNVQELDLAYLVISDVTIPADLTLTIDPGVVVKFMAVDAGGSGQYCYRHDIFVNGVLNLQGTSGSPVVFTSSRDDTYGGDTNGDDDDSSPAKGNWGAIHYQGSVANVLHDAVLRYGGVGHTYHYSNYYYDTQMVWILNEASVTIQDCVIEQSHEKAVLAEDNSAVAIQDSTVRNSSYGIYVQESATADINSNALESNSYGLYQAGSSQLIVTDNTFTNNSYPVYQGGTDPIYSGNTITGNTYQAIAVGGTLAHDVVWENVQELDLPYLVISDVTVPAALTLTIEGGIVVKFLAVDAGGSGQYRYRHDIIVDGMLSLQGASGSPVVFTSSRDDTYGGDTNSDADASSPAKGNWGAIRYQGSVPNVLHNAVLRYGGVGHTYHYANYYYDTQMVWVKNDASVTIRDNTIEQAYQKLVYIEGQAQVFMRDNWMTSATRGIQMVGTSDVVVLFSTIFDCTDNAIRVEGSAVVDVHKCNLLSSCPYGIYNAGTVEVDAEHNYWGAADGPGPVGLGGGSGVTELVDYDPWESEIVPPGYATPVITSIPNLTGVFGLPYEYDPDGCASATATGTLVWSKRRGPDEFQIDSATGCITWTPSQPGPIVISIEVADDVSMDVQSFQVMVAGSGGDADAPRVESFSQAEIGGGEGTWDAELTVVFSENVGVSWFDVAILDSGDNMILPDSLGYHFSTHTLTIEVSDLNEGETYWLVLFETITDDARNPLDGEFDGSTFPSGDGVAGGDFLASFSKTVYRSGDFDRDGDIDLDDYVRFVCCMGGPEVSQEDGWNPPYDGGGCTQGQFDIADMDGDGDVDMFDLAWFQEYFTGAK
ncbi:MAG: right-handed parallel beta-helix repeat-containing protein [Phycisphaerae bacterium]|nr:right-handed parallel beta-helix repeat-containing protein [Phycisphaerae bacterium]